jgi:malonate transporter and related proteins
LLDVVLAAIAPAYVVIALGYLIGRRRGVDKCHLATLNALVMDSALPAAQFFLQKRGFRVDTRRASLISLTSAFPNVVSVGVPLMAFVVGTAERVAAPIAAAIAARTTLHALSAHACGTNRVRADRRCGSVDRQPRTAAGTRKLPERIALGADGAGLFLTGLVLSSQPFCVNPNVVSATLLKNVAQPLLAAAVVVLLAAPALIGREAILLSAVPAASFGVLIAFRYRVASPDIGSTFMVSSVLSVMTVPAAILLTGGSPYVVRSIPPHRIDRSRLARGSATAYSGKPSSQPP